MKNAIQTVLATSHPYLNIATVQTNFQTAKLETTAVHYKIIKEYILNSHRPKTNIKIDDIFALTKSKYNEETSRHHSSGRSTARSRATPPYKMLLWSRSCPKLFKKLIDKQNSYDSTCLVFYDRLYPALPKNLKERTEMTVLLCSVRYRHISYRAFLP